MGAAGYHGPDHLIHIQAAVDDTAAPRLDMDEMVRPMVAGGAHITDFLLK